MHSRAETVPTPEVPPQGTDFKAEQFGSIPLSALMPEALGIPEGSSFSIPNSSRRVQVRERPIVTSSGPALKVGYAQVRSEPGFLAESAATHIATIVEAHRRGCQLLQFPELSLPNYCCHDLFLDRAFLKAQRAWLDTVVKSTLETPGLTAVIGFVDVDWSKERPGNRPWAYNALAVVRDGEIVEIVHKKLLPNYDIFDEVRRFESGTGTKIVEVNGV